MRNDSTPCCSTWLAEAASRAVFIVFIPVMFIVNSEPRNKAAVQAAIADSMRVVPAIELALDRIISAFRPVNEQATGQPYNFQNRMRGVCRRDSPGQNRAYNSPTG